MSVFLRICLCNRFWFRVLSFGDYLLFVLCSQSQTITAHPHMPLASSYGHLDASGMHPAAVLRWSENDHSSENRDDSDHDGAIAAQRRQSPQRRSHCCRSVSAHLAAGSNLLEIGAWITDPKGGLMCSAVFPDPQQQQQQQHVHQSEDTIIWAEACATMASRAALTAEMQVQSSQPLFPSKIPTHLHGVTLLSAACIVC